MAEINKMEESEPGNEIGITENEDLRSLQKLAGIGAIESAAISGRECIGRSGIA